MCKYKTLGYTGLFPFHIERPSYLPQWACSYCLKHKLVWVMACHTVKFVGLAIHRLICYWSEYLQKSIPNCTNPFTWRGADIRAASSETLFLSFATNKNAVSLASSLFVERNLNSEICANKNDPDFNNSLQLRRRACVLPDDKRGDRFWRSFFFYI